MVAPDLTVHDNAEAGAYHATIGPQVVGTIAYQRDRTTLTIKHTSVELELQGQGIASAFVQQVLDRLRAEGVTVRNECSFVASFLTDHPDYAPMVDPAPADDAGDG